MTKKVIDIISPKEAKKIRKKEVKQLLSKPRMLDYPSVSEGRRRKPVFILLFLFFLGIFSYAYFILPKAEIRIWPKTEVLTAETKLIVGRKISGEVLESIETIEQNFFSSNKFFKKTKAEGVIRLYNNYSTASQVLIPRTRFMSACGKIFRTPVRVVIPGKHRKAGKWVSGTIDIKVIAGQPGNEFNIDSTAFSIPGFTGLARFTAIYGRSYQPMTGGEIRKVIQVSQEDLDLAKNILTEKAEESCLVNLKNERDNQEFSILKEAVEMNILESFADVEVGAEVEEFIFQIKAKCRTIGFKKHDIKKFGLDFLGNQISKEKLIVPESLEIDYSLENIALAQGEMVLSLDLFVALYSGIDQFALQRELAGKSLTEAQVFLENLLQVNKVDVNFWPFWVESVPKNLNRIIIKLKFN